MPVTETIEEQIIEQPLSRPTVQTAGLDPAQPATEPTSNDPQPTPKSHWSTKLKSGDLQRPRVKRTAGATGVPTQRATQSPVQTPAAPIAQIPETATVPAPVAPAPIAPVPVAPAQPVTVQPEIVPPVAAPPVAAPLAATAPVSPRVLRAESGDDLIELPGEKPRTLNQLRGELGKVRQQDQREGQLNYREAQLTTRERDFEQRAIQATRPTVHTQEPVPQPAAPQPIAEKRPPERPAGAIEGDPEWTEWQAKLSGFYAAQELGSEIDKRLAPIIDDLNQTKARRDAQTQAEQLAKTRYANNDRVYTQALLDHLPFDPRGLSQEAFDQVNARIREVALSTDPELDIFDQAKMSQFELSQREAALLVRSAYPAGSLPPGYAAQEQQPIPGIPTPEKPIVAAPPKKPLPSTIADALPPRDTQGASQRPGSKTGWHERLRTGGLNPVTIRRSRGST